MENKYKTGSDAVSQRSTQGGTAWGTSGSASNIYADMPLPSGVGTSRMSDYRRGLGDYKSSFDYSRYTSPQFQGRATGPSTQPSRSDVVASGATAQTQTSTPRSSPEPSEFKSPSTGNSSRQTSAGDLSSGPTSTQQTSDTAESELEVTRQWVNEIRSLARYAQDARKCYGLSESEASENIWRRWHDIKLMIDSQRKRLVRDLMIQKRKRRRTRKAPQPQSSNEGEVSHATGDVGDDLQKSRTKLVETQGSSSIRALIPRDEANLLAQQELAKFAKLGRSIARKARLRNKGRQSIATLHGKNKDDSPNSRSTISNSTASAHIDMIPFLHAIKSAWELGNKLNAKASSSSSTSSLLRAKIEKHRKSFQAKKASEDPGDLTANPDDLDEQTSEIDEDDEEELDEETDGSGDSDDDQSNRDPSTISPDGISSDDESDREHDEEHDASSGGLNSEQFVAFISELLSAPPEEVEVLFRKIDANDDGDLSWYEYLSYLYREVAYRRHMRTARGAYALWEDDRPPARVDKHSGAAHVRSIFVVPSSATPPYFSSGLSARGLTPGHRLPHYLFSTSDNHIHVWTGAPSKVREEDGADESDLYLTSSATKRSPKSQSSSTGQAEDCFAGFIEPTSAEFSSDYGFGGNYGSHYVSGALAYQSTFPLAGLAKVTAPHAARLGSFVTPLVCDHSHSPHAKSGGSHASATDHRLQSVKASLPEGVAAASTSSASRAMLSQLHRHVTSGQFKEMPDHLATNAKATAEEAMGETPDDRALDEDQYPAAPIPGVRPPGRFQTKATAGSDSHHSVQYTPASPNVVPYQLAADSYEIPVYECVDQVATLFATTTPTAIANASEYESGDPRVKTAVRLIAPSKLGGLAQHAHAQHRLSFAASGQHGMGQASRLHKGASSNRAYYENLHHGTRLAAIAGGKSSSTRHRGGSSGGSLLHGGVNAIYGGNPINRSLRGGFGGSSFVTTGAGEGGSSVRRDVETWDSSRGTADESASGRNEMLADVRRLENELLINVDSKHESSLGAQSSSSVSTGDLAGVQKAPTASRTSKPASSHAVYATGRPSGLPHTSMCISTHRKQVILAGSERLMYFFSSDALHQYRLTDFFMTQVEAQSMTCVEDALICGDAQGRVYFYNLRGRPCGSSGTGALPGSLMGGRVGRVLASPIYESSYNSGFAEYLDETETFQVLAGDGSQKRANVPLNTSLAPNPVAHMHLHAGRPVRKLEYVPHLGLVSAGMDGRIGISSIYSVGQNIRYLGRLAVSSEEATYGLSAANGAALETESPLVSNVGAGMGAAGEYTALKLDSYAKTFSTSIGEGDIQGSKSILGTSSATGNANGAEETWTGRSHSKGVQTFAVTSTFIASAGPDSSVLIWDPYVKESVGSLPARCGKVVDIISNEPYNQLIVISDDKKIRVFDMRTFNCVQNISDAFPYVPRNNITATAFDHESQKLITAAGNARFRLWSVGPASGSRSSSNAEAHDAAVVFVGHAPAFNQLVSVAADGSVRLWDIATGKAVFEFTVLSKGTTSTSNPDSGDGASAEIEQVSSLISSSGGSRIVSVSCSCFDLKRRRLITSTTTGVVCMWNFNNGALMHEFPVVARREFGAVHYLGRGTHPFVGLAWEAPMVRWPDPSLSLAIAKPLLQEVMPRRQHRVETQSTGSIHAKAESNAHGSKSQLRKGTRERTHALAQEPSNSSNGTISTVPLQKRRHERLARALAKAQAPNLEFEATNISLSSDQITGLMGTNINSTVPVATAPDAHNAAVQIRPVPPGLDHNGLGEQLCVDSRAATMVTGTSLGYILVWNTDSLHLSSRTVVPVSPSVVLESEAECALRELGGISIDDLDGVDLYDVGNGFGWWAGAKRTESNEESATGNSAMNAINDGYTPTQILMLRLRKNLAQRLQTALSNAIHNVSVKQLASNSIARSALDHLSASIKDEPSSPVDVDEDALHRNKPEAAVTGRDRSPSPIVQPSPAATPRPRQGSLQSGTDAITMSLSASSAPSASGPSVVSTHLGTANAARTSAQPVRATESQSRKQPPAVTAVKFIQLINPANHPSLAPYFRAAGIDSEGNPIPAGKAFDEPNTHDSISGLSDATVASASNRTVMAQTFLFVGTETGDVHVYIQQTGSLTLVLSQFGVMRGPIVSFAFLSNFGNVPDPLLEPLQSNIQDALYSAFATPLQETARERDISKISVMPSSTNRVSHDSPLRGPSPAALVEDGDKSTTGSKNPSSLIYSKPQWGPRRTYMMVTDNTEARIFELPKLGTPAEYHRSLLATTTPDRPAPVYYFQADSQIPAVPQIGNCPHELAFKIVREFIPHIPYSSVAAMISQQLHLQSHLRQEIQEIANMQVQLAQEQQKALRQLEGESGPPVMRSYLLQQQMQAEAQTHLNNKQKELLHSPQYDNRQQRLIFDAERLRSLQFQQESSHVPRSKAQGKSGICLKTSSACAHFTLPHRPGPLAIAPRESQEALEHEILLLKAFLAHPIGNLPSVPSTTTAPVASATTTSTNQVTHDGASKDPALQALIAKVDNMIDAYVASLRPDELSTQLTQVQSVSDLISHQQQQLQTLLQNQATEVQQQTQLAKYRRVSMMAGTASPAPAGAHLSQQHAKQVMQLIEMQENQLKQFYATLLHQRAIRRSRSAFLDRAMYLTAPLVCNIARSPLSPSSVPESSLLRSLVPARITAGASVFSTQAFVTASESGEVKLWSRSGLFVAELGVRPSVPILQIIREHEERARDLEPYLPIYMQRAPQFISATSLASEEAQSLPSSAQPRATIVAATETDPTFISEIVDDEKQNHSSTALANSTRNFAAVDDYEDQMMSKLISKSSNGMRAAASDEDDDNGIDDNAYGIAGASGDQDTFAEDDSLAQQRKPAMYSKVTATSLSRILDPPTKLVIKMPRRIASLQSESIGSNAAIKPTKQASLGPLTGAAKQLAENLRAMTTTASQPH